MEISGAFPVLNQDYLDTFFSFDEPTSQQSVNPDIHQQVPIPAGAQGRIEKRPSFSMPQGQPNGAGSQEPIGWSTVGQPSPFTDMSQPSFSLDMSQQSFGPSGYELSTGFSTPQYPANVGEDPMVSASSPAANPLLGEGLMVSGSSGLNPGAAPSGQAYSITPMPPAAAAISNQGLRQQRPSAGTPVRPTTYVPRTLKELKMRGYAPTDNVAANNIYHEKLYGKLVKKENAKKRRLNKLHK
ncbi:hypothetical protein UCREL1_8424 [Eutypa lata UCREL1]|uniref:Uncharacterized protein n=1 Tax=Eutypa lata (strain UCR-EL1) TaxID=1287681 RepID=M7T4A8_EUTLA|nr:hypothetical protein UCREL1_8424 [Eutypa lata UCREL1]